MDMLGKYKLHSNNSLDKVDDPSLNLQLVERDEARFCKEIADKNRELRQLQGLDLQGLTIDELEHLETLLQGGLIRVLKTKDERFGNEISSLHEKVRVSSHFYCHLYLVEPDSSF
ncbi:MADS-box protein AGL24-like protein isoform X1 [Tanacetum coccineum]